MAADEQVWRVVADSSDALKLIATWPRVGAEIGDKDFASGRALDDKLVENWHVLSKVWEEDIKDWWPTLISNEIIGPNGQVDPEIEKFMKVTLASYLK